MRTICSFILLFLIIPATANAQTMYTVTDLGSLGGTETFITGVNSSGTAVGGSTDASGRLRAFIWQDGSMQSIEPPVLDGFTRSFATGISNSGKVVGIFDNQESCDFPTCKAVAFVYDKSVQVLPSLAVPPYGLPMTRGYGVSNSGYVVGTSVTSEGWLRGFVFRNGAMRELGTLGEAFAVNSKGVAVGMATVTGGYHAVRFRGDTVQDLGTLGSNTSRALGINSAGEVVGYSDTTNNEKIRGFVVRGNQMYDLGSLGGRDSLALAINNSSQIVGGADTVSRGAHAFLYQNGGMVDLNDHITDSRWGLIRAIAISDAGVIGVSATFEGVHNKAVLLTPIIQ